uniref:DUF1985 domain-containing protein n=1 Tax=Brassica oleracea TaxID=3712 RepID=A0A3P6B3P4_BRAOL|nr:unnamed protein product [Brassica oleracea]
MPELPPLHDEEYEELKESKLGVFIKFQELGFDWASRLVHYMLGFQLDIKKKYELWNLVGPEPEIITSLERCEGWSRDDRKRLAYLAIFTGYIEGRKYSTPTRVSLARLVMELERFENYSWGRVAFKVLMDSLIMKLDAEIIREDYPDYLIISLLLIHIFYLLQTRVINFVQKDIGEMFPKWEFDVEDTLAENIIKLMFVKKPWKWTMDCWEVTGTWSSEEKGSEGSSPRPRKKARKEAPAEFSEDAAAEASEKVTTTVGGLTKEDIKTMFKDIADTMREWFGTCLKEIKFLSERVEAVEKKVGITTKRKGTSSQNTTSPPKPTLEPGVSNESSPYKRLTRQSYKNKN